MIYFDFDYRRAASLEDAVALLGSLQGTARALAGGTDLLPSMRMENVKPGLLVSLGAIEARAPELLPNGSLRLDALSRLSTIENSDLLAARAPMIALSAHVVGGNQIRQMGTLGGNLCQEVRCLQLDQRHDYQFVAPCYKRGGDCCYPYPRNARDTCWSVFMSDVAPALIALNAEIEIVGEAGMRRIRVEDLYTGSGLKPTQLAPSELLSAVIVPPASPRSGW
jgi:CO/xanthine dehydrogenase FAD-binding subunit